MGLKILKTRDKLYSSDSSLSSPELEGTSKKFSLFRAPLVPVSRLSVKPAVKPAVVPATPTLVGRSFPPTSTPCLKEAPPFHLSQTLLSPVSKENSDLNSQKPKPGRSAVSREHTFDNLLTSRACLDASSKLVLNRREKPLPLRNHGADVDRTRQYGGKIGSNNIFTDDLEDEELVIHSPKRKQPVRSGQKGPAQETAEKVDALKLEAVRKKVFDTEARGSEESASLKADTALTTKKKNVIERPATPNKSAGKERSLVEKIQPSLEEKSPRRKSARRSGRGTKTAEEDVGSDDHSVDKVPSSPEQQSPPRKSALRSRSGPKRAEEEVLSSDDHSVEKVHSRSEQKSPPRKSAQKSRSGTKRAEEEVLSSDEDLHRSPEQQSPRRKSARKSRNGTKRAEEEVLSSDNDHSVEKVPSSPVQQSPPRKSARKSRSGTKRAEEEVLSSDDGLHKSPEQQSPPRKSARKSRGGTKRAGEEVLSSDDGLHKSPEQKSPPRKGARKSHSGTKRAEEEVLSSDDGLHKSPEQKSPPRKSERKSHSGTKTAEEEVLSSDDGLHKSPEQKSPPRKSARKNHSGTKRAEEEVLSSDDGLHKSPEQQSPPRKSARKSHGGTKRAEEEVGSDDAPIGQTPDKETKENNTNLRTKPAQNGDSNSSVERDPRRIQNSKTDKGKESSVLEDISGARDSEVNSARRGAVVEKSKLTPRKEGQQVLEEISSPVLSTISKSGKKKRQSTVARGNSLTTHKKQNLGGNLVSDDEDASRKQNGGLTRDGPDRSSRDVLQRRKSPVKEDLLKSIGLIRKSLEGDVNDRERNDPVDSSSQDGAPENPGASETDAGPNSSTSRGECSPEPGRPNRARSPERSGVVVLERLGKSGKSAQPPPSDSGVAASERTVLTEKGSGKTYLTVIEESGNEISAHAAPKQRRTGSKKRPEQESRRRKKTAAHGPDRTSDEDGREGDAEAAVEDAEDNATDKEESRAAKEEARTTEKRDAAAIKKTVKKPIKKTSPASNIISDRPKRERRRPGDYWIPASNLTIPVCGKKDTNCGGMSKTRAIDHSTGSEDDCRPTKKRPYKKLSRRTSRIDQSENVYEKTANATKKRRLLSKTRPKIGYPDAENCGSFDSDCKPTSVLISHADSVSLRNKNCGIATENTKVRIGPTVSWKSLSGSFLELDPGGLSGPQIDVFKLKVLVVVEGTIDLEIISEENQNTLTAGDTAVVPAGSKFTIRNHGPTKARLNVLDFEDHMI